jgi:large subunit ribosomal protein L4
MALSSKLKENNLIVIDRLELDQIGTKGFMKVLKALNVEHTLIVTGKSNKNLELSSRNIPDVKVLRTEGLNVYDILKYRSLVLVEASIKDIEGRLLK